MYTLQQIISWMPHGRAWKIHNRELLMTEVVPKYFTMKKYESFQRQINGWGFKLLYQSGNDKGAYYHEYFLRGMPHLLVLIQRVPPKEKMKVLKYKSTKDEEPNFYMDPLQPLFMPTLSSCPNKSDQESLSEDMSITPIPYGNRPKLALHYNTNQPASRRYHPTTMTNIHDLPNQQHQLTHPLQHQNNNWMCSVKNDYEQQSTIRHVSEDSDTQYAVNNDTKCKVDAVLQAFIKRSFERHNMEYEPTIASANGSAEGAHHYWNNDCASLIPCSPNDAVEKNEEEMVAQHVVRNEEEDSLRLSLEAQDKPIETSWLCRPCKNIDFL
jgi:hypothetical protein